MEEGMDVFRLSQVDLKARNRMLRDQSECVRVCACVSAKRTVRVLGRVGVRVVDTFGLFIGILSGFPSPCPYPPPPVPLSPHVHYLPTHSWLSLPSGILCGTLSHLHQYSLNTLHTHTQGVSNQFQ